MRVCRQVTMQVVAQGGQSVSESCLRSQPAHRSAIELTRMAELTCAWVDIDVMSLSLCVGSISIAVGKRECTPLTSKRTRRRAEGQEGRLVGIRPTP